MNAARGPDQPHPVGRLCACPLHAVLERGVFVSEIESAAWFMMRTLMK